ncbi:MAG: type II toxin-antitoxin system VapB family antitoxin [Arcicella sp.]|nr:type II toxin-antitoxin system VapB family antitoxin [Arcicella sp.]
MRTNIDINDDILKEISRFKPSASKKELVNIALKEYLMYLRRMDILTIIDQGIDWEGDLEQWRTQ